MLNATKPTSIQAILVMDSRKTSIAVRSQNFTGSWSQLYKAGDFYLDLSLKPSETEAMLIGQISGPAQLAEEISGIVSVKNGQGVASGTISPRGSFRLALSERGEHLLEIALKNRVLQVSRLEI